MLLHQGMGKTSNGVVLLSCLRDSLMNPGLALIHGPPRHDYYQHIKKTGMPTNFLQPSVVD